jgi:spore coat polysaccharide biosynthesis predicted glycosyltransferase SpsG
VFAICIEGSHTRGLGHLFRGLALLRALESRGAAVRFYANDDPAVARALEERGQPWTRVPLRDAASGWISERVRADGIRTWIADCFETSVAHARAVRDAGARFVTFNDRGPGAAHADLHVCAVPLDEGGAPPGRRVLTGMAYLVLDPVLRTYRRQRTALGSLVVSMGGADTYGLTIEVLRALRARRRQATVVVGPGFAHERELAGLAGEDFLLRRSVASLAEEFARHDLAITAGGVTPFEANAAGLPCVIIAAEPWEERAGRLLAGLGGCRYAGSRHAIDFGALDEALPVERMSAAALAAVPADGADRVAAELLAL